MPLPIAVLLFAWSLGGTTPRADCTLATTEPGLTLRCKKDAKGTFATATDRAAAEQYRMQRVTVSGELQTEDVEGGASFWLRVDADKKMLLLDNGSGDMLTGDSGWTRRSITLPVPADATSLVYGVLLRGGGNVEVRNFKLESSPIDIDKPLAAPARKELDAAFSIVRKNALRAADVDWTTVEPQVRVVAAGAETAEDVYPAIRYLLGALGDNHSFLMPAAQMRSGEAPKNRPIEVRLHEPGIGYVDVPGYSGGERAAMNTHVRNTHQAIARTASGAQCGWIIDLRHNGGGNMWPMLAALRPFLGDAPLGSFSGPTTKAPHWYANAVVKLSPPRSLRSLAKAKVAVLTAPRTASSGEAVTVAFRGRPSTRSFGEPTRGLSTANAGFPLPDGATIQLTTAIYVDRTGTRYGDKIEPDEQAEDALAAATTWLKTGCNAQR